MGNPFTDSNRLRKQGTKQWLKHKWFYGGIFVAIYATRRFGLGVVSEQLPDWLTALGAGPLMVRLIVGSLLCALGAWGVRKQEYGLGWRVTYVLCLVGGVLTLAGIVLN